MRSWGIVPPRGRGPEPEGVDGGTRAGVDEVRQATSLALRPHKLEARRGAHPQEAVYSVRITAAAKPAIRKRLEALFGFTHSTIYPDYTGFSSFGTPKLRTRP